MKEVEKVEQIEQVEKVKDPKDIKDLPPAPMFRDEAAAPDTDGAPVPYPTFLENLSAGFWDF